MADNDIYLVVLAILAIFLIVWFCKKKYDQSSRDGYCYSYLTAPYLGGWINYDGDHPISKNIVNQAIGPAFPMATPFKGLENVDWRYSGIKALNDQNENELNQDWRGYCADNNSCVKHDDHSIGHVKAMTAGKHSHVKAMKNHLHREMNPGDVEAAKIWEVGKNSGANLSRYNLPGYCQYCKYNQA